MIEVLVTTVLVAVAISGVLQALGSVEAAQAKAQTVDRLMRLASEKMEDLKILADPADGGSSGDFSDRGYPNTTWSLTETTTSITNLDEVTITVTDGKDSQSLNSMVYVAPATSSSTANGTANSGSTGGGTTP